MKIELLIEDGVPNVLFHKEGKINKQELKDILQYLNNGTFGEILNYILKQKLTTEQYHSILDTHPALTPIIKSDIRKNYGEMLPE